MCMCDVHKVRPESALGGACMLLLLLPGAYIRQLVVAATAHMLWCARGCLNNHKGAVYSSSSLWQSLLIYYCLLSPLSHGLVCT